MIYATDTECIVQRFKGINHMLIECNYVDALVNKEAVNYSHRLQGHMSIDTACEFVKQNKSNELLNIIMCHLSNETSDENVFIQKMNSASNSNNYIAIKNTVINLDLLPF